MLSKAVSRFGTSQILFGLAVGILVIFVAVPVLLIFFNALWVDGSLNVVHVLNVLREPNTYKALINSLILAMGVTITGTIVGAFFTWLVTRTDLPYKGAMKVFFSCHSCCLRLLVLWPGRCCSRLVLVISTASSWKH